ncbi:MAG: carboxylesterase [Gammaproteobacteria bacterium]|nr:carboxylesterase [Gammaproteobacteria bacterium]
MFKKFVLPLITLLGWQVGAAQILEVDTAAGSYQGLPSPLASDVSVFRGLAFAAPPVGDMRWKPPLPPATFSGVRLAERSGSACWQARTSDNSVYARGNLDRSEDCLTLNVFTAAVDDSAGLPVMIWFHGGSNTAGHGGARIFDGTNLAARGAVVVTANYRLGPLGFLAHPALTAESEQAASGNYGLLDQVAALQWVQKNIAHFGGDPGRVTIFGQSAGGEDVCLLMASPLTTGLIHRVIGQSPSSGCVRLERPLQGGADSAHASGVRFLGALGIKDSGALALAAMRDLSPEEITATASSEGNSTGPIIDGWVLPEAPARLFAQGDYNHVPVMMGALAEEYSGLQAGAAEISEADLDAFLTRRFGVDGLALKTGYKGLIGLSPISARKAIAGDNGFIRTVRDWARLISANNDTAYVYYFSRPVPVFRLYMPSMPDLAGDGGGRSLGAYHSGELAYVFDNLGTVGIGWESDDYLLSATIADYWFNFAKSGNPNAPGLPYWPAYEPTKDEVQVLDVEVRNAVHPRSAFIDRIEALATQ